MPVRALRLHVKFICPPIIIHKSESINAREGIKTKIAHPPVQLGDEQSESINAREGIKTGLSASRSG